MISDYIPPTGYDKINCTVTLTNICYLFCGKSVEIEYIMQFAVKFQEIPEISLKLRDRRKF